MTTTLSDDALSAQQSRIMDAMKANAQPSQQQVSPQDLLQAITANNAHTGDYFSMMKQDQATQAQDNVNAQTGIYAQMKEQVARGNSDAAAVDKAITDVAGDDPKIYAGIAQQLHSDPEKVTPANARGKVMKYAAEMGVNPLTNQEASAKVQGERAKTAQTLAEAAKAQGEANQLNIFNPGGQTGMPTGTSQPTGQTSTSSQTPGTPVGTNRNDDYLSTLPTPIATQVKAIADGRMALPNGMALKTPYWQQMLQAVGNYDPNFDAVNYNARAKTRADFTSGKSAQNITSLNTAIGHLDALDKALGGLKNSDYPAYNAVANAVGRNLGNKDIQTAMKDVNSKAIAVSGELAKVFRSTGMSQKEIEDWKDQISPNNSPAENKKVIESAIDLMNSRLDAVGEQYNKGMGTTADAMQLLSPKSQKIIQRLQSSQPEEKIATGESIRTASESIPAKTDPNVKASSAVTIGGKSYIQQNGKWYEK